MTFLFLLIIGLITKLHIDTFVLTDTFTVVIELRMRSVVFIMYNTTSYTPFSTRYVGCRCLVADTENNELDLFVATSAIMTILGMLFITSRDGPPSRHSFDAI
jgi:hypothetical protein